MTIANTVSNTTFTQLRTKVNQVIGVVNSLQSNGFVANTSQLVNGIYTVNLQANGVLTLPDHGKIVFNSANPEQYIEGTQGFRIYASDGVSISVASNTYSFGNDGSITFPSGTKLESGYPGLGYIDNFATLAGDYVYLSSANGYAYIGVENQIPVIGNGPHIWAFDPDGTIRFPDNTIQSTAYTGSAAYLQVANANATFATKAYAASNTAVRLLINDRIQVANVANKYATKAYAASNAYVKLLLANTNSYIATVAAAASPSSGSFDYGFIISAVDPDTQQDYGTL